MILYDTIFWHLSTLFSVIMFFDMFFMCRYLRVVIGHRHPLHSHWTLQGWPLYLAKIDDSSAFFLAYLGLWDIFRIWDVLYMKPTWFSSGFVIFGFGFTLVNIYKFSISFLKSEFSKPGFQSTIVSFFRYTFFDTHEISHHELQVEDLVSYQLVY